MISSKPKQLILIGASTGGPGFIEKIIGSLGNTIDAAIIVAVHMNKLLLDSFAKRLNRINDVAVEFMTQETQIQNGKVYLLEETSILYQKNSFIFLDEQKPLTGYYHPTIDELFLSAAQLSDIQIISYLLTGIGADGAKGMLALKNKGHRTVAQDEKTSIVYGMPKRAFEMGATTAVMSIEEIIKDIQAEI